MKLDKRQFLKGSAAFAGSMVCWSITARGTAFGADMQKITVAHSVNTTIYAAHMVAQAKGFAKDQGLDMTVIEAKGGSNVRKILAAGQVQYALGDSSHPLQLTNRGMPSKILMATDNRCSYANIVIRKELYDKGITTLEKLAQYRRDGELPVIAATGIGSGTWVYGTYVLESLGIGDQFNWVAGGGSKTLLGGLQTAKFDAVMAVPAWIYRAEDDGYGKLIYDTADKASWEKVFGGNIPATVVYVLDDTIAENKDATQKYVNAMYQSMQWLGSSSDQQIYDVVGPMMPGFQKDAVLREIAYYKKVWQFDGSFPEADFANGAKVWFREKTKIKPVKYADVTDMSFLANAAKA